MGNFRWSIRLFIWQINGWNILFSIFCSPSLFPPSDSKPESLEAHKIKTAFFTHPTLTEIGRRLVSHYFLLTEEELAMWEEDPESFGNNAPRDAGAKSKCWDLSGPADWQLTKACSREVENSESWPVPHSMERAGSLWLPVSPEFIVYSEFIQQGVTRK